MKDQKISTTLGAIILVIISATITSLVLVCFKKYPVEDNIDSVIVPEPEFNVCLNDFMPNIEEKLFLAYKNADLLEVSIYDPESDFFIASKTIALEDRLTNHTTNFSSGSNDGVQYNPVSKEVFFVTQGSNEYDGSCSNADGTCLNRIFKSSMNEGGAVKIFESDYFINHWIVNDIDNSIILELYGDDQKNQLVKIDARDGSVIFQKSIQGRQYENFSEFVLSAKQNKVLQSKIEVPEGKMYHNHLRVNIINQKTGDVKEHSAFKGDSLDCESDLSSNNCLVASYKGWMAQELKIYDYHNKKLTDVPFECSIQNLNLFWSGDDEKLLYQCYDGKYYFDYNAKKSVKIDGIESSAHILKWAPSVNYIVYEKKGFIYIFDISTQESKNTTIKPEYELIGLSWY